MVAPRRRGYNPFDPYGLLVGYQPPVPKLAGTTQVGPTVFTPTTTLPLPPLGAKLAPMPALQKITVAPPLAYPAMPTMGGPAGAANAGTSALQRSVLSAIENQMASQAGLLPTPFDKKLQAAQDAAAIKAIVNPKITKTAQDEVDALNAKRALEGLPPLAEANAAKADKAQTAADQAKRTNPSAHYLAGVDGITQYSQDFGLDLSAEDIKQLDLQAAQAAKYALTNQPKAYWDAISLQLQLPPRATQSDIPEGSRRTAAPSTLDYVPTRDTSTDVQGVSMDESLTPEQQLYGLTQHTPGIGQGTYLTAANEGPFLNPSSSALPLPPGGSVGDVPRTTEQMNQGLVQASGAATGAAALAAAITRARGGSWAQAAAAAVGLAAISGLSAAEILDGRKSPEELATQALGLSAATVPAGQVAGAFTGNPANVARGGEIGAGAAVGASLLGNLLPPDSPISQAVDAAGNTVNAGWDWFNKQVANPAESLWVGENLQLPSWLMPQSLEGYKTANIFNDPAQYRNSPLYDPSLSPAENEAKRQQYASAIAPYYAPTADLPALDTNLPIVPKNYQNLVDYAAQRSAANTPLQNITEQLTNPLNILPFEMVGRGAEAVAGGLGAANATRAGNAARAAAQAATAAGAMTERSPLQLGAGPRTADTIQADWHQAQREWGQFLNDNPDVPEEQTYQHPAYQQMQALEDELKASQAIPRYNANEGTPVEEPVVATPVDSMPGEVAPPVAAEAAATAGTEPGALVHPVTGADMRTGDPNFDAQIGMQLEFIQRSGHRVRSATTPEERLFAQNELKTVVTQAFGPEGEGMVGQVVQAELARVPTANVHVSDEAAYHNDLVQRLYQQSMDANAADDMRKFQALRDTLQQHLDNALRAA